MQILFEIELKNITKDEIDHFRLRRNERLFQAELDINTFPLRNIVKEYNLPLNEVIDIINQEVKHKVNENIGKVASIQTTYAVIPVGILYIKYKDKKIPLNYKGIDGSYGHVYYIPVTKNIASTLILTDNEVYKEWQRAHATRDIPISQIEYIPLIGSDIIIDLEKIISNIILSKKEIIRPVIFTIDDLPYELDSDYRPKKEGKQNYFKLKVFDKNKFPILTTSGNEFIKDVTVKADNPNAAQIYVNKLSGKKNGLKPWEIIQQGSNLIFKNTYTTLGFNKQKQWIGSKIVKETILRRYIQLLERLTSKDIKLI
jgi:hypothetical protein